jgi:hypothetical protein
MPSKSGRKGYTYEKELVNELSSNGFRDVIRAWGSDGRSMGVEADVDILADGVKIQAKRRKSIPKWLSLGHCDLLMFRADNRQTHVVMTLSDYVRLLQDN